MSAYIVEPVKFNPEDNDAVLGVKQYPFTAILDIMIERGDGELIDGEMQQELTMVCHCVSVSPDSAAEEARELAIETIDAGIEAGLSFEIQVGAVLYGHVIPFEIDAADNQDEGDDADD